MNGSIENRFKTEHTYLNRTLQKLSSKISEYTAPKTFNTILLLSFAKAHMMIEFFDQSLAVLSMTRNCLEKDL